MKKRILALALAGTTAFSVFGAAMSASAADPTPIESAHVASQVDAYRSYTPVATKIVVNKGTADTYKIYDSALYTNITAVGHEIDNKADYLNKIITQADYSDAVWYPVTIGGNTNYLTADGKVMDVNGRVYGPDNDVAYTEATIPAATLTALGITKVATGYTVNNGANPNIYRATLTDAVKEVLKQAQDTNNANVTPGVVGHYLLPASVGKKNFGVAAVISLSDAEYLALKADKAAYESAYIKNLLDANGKPIVAGAGAPASIAVTPNDSAAYDEWTEWTWVNNTDATATIDVWEDNSYYKDTDGDGKKDTLVVDQKNVPTIYAYDFLSTNESTARTTSWNNDKVGDTVNELLYNNAPNATLNAERGRGVAGRGVRYDVVSDWQDFLDELAIHHNGTQHAITDYNEYLSNYSDLYQYGYYYDVYTGNATSAVWSTDIYNIKNLLKDIWDLSTPTAYEAANTSQMVYLMQQYDKYVGNYITPDEVENDAWGDLLLTLLKSANEEDFKRGATDYKKYMRAVEDLEDAYNDATTASMVKAAEVGMYELLTRMDYTKASSNNWYGLYGTMSGLYFNAKNVLPTYTVAPSDITNPAFTNYNYLVAVSKQTNSQVNADNYTLTDTYKAGYYTLYPMADYIDYDASTPNELYPGNTNAGTDYKGAYATEEYEWFWNVYQLAANMLYGKNEYKGVLEATQAALEEAVAALTATKTPTGSAVTALEETIADYEDALGEEADYNKDYYAKYAQALAFADVAEGKTQTQIAREMVETAGYALTYQGTQVTVTKNDIKTLQDAIKEGNTALKAIKEDKNYNAAQVNELNKAIANAEVIVDLWNGVYSNSATKQSVNKIGSKAVGDKDQFVKSDLTAAIEAIDDAIKGSTVVQGWYNNGTAWQYGEGDDYLNDGWHFIDKVWYYFDEDATAKQSEWAKIDGTWYYFNSNAGAARGWCKVKNEWYYFDQNTCAMKTGWVKVDGNWYYLNAGGKMLCDWQLIGGKWYYFSKESNSLGQMLANTTVEGYKLGADGAMIEK